MSRLMSLILLCCAILSISPAGAATARERCREGYLLFDMPDGWQRKKTDGAPTGWATLAPTELPPGKWIELRILPPQPLKVPLRDAVAAEIAKIRQSFPAAQQQSPVSLVRHPRGFDVAFVSVSMNSGRAADEFLYTGIYLAGIGDTVESIVVIANDADLFNRNRAMTNSFVNSVNFTTLEVIVPGTPPLTQATVDQVVDFLEWLLEAPFTDDQRTTVRTFMVDSWRKRDKVEMDGAADILKARGQLSAMPPDRRVLAREQIREGAVKEWRTQNDAVAKLMVSIYDASRQPLAQGNPPLTRQSADAAVEMLFFMASQVAGGDPVAPTQPMKDQFAANLASGYAQLSDNDRKSVAEAPLTWAGIRANWPETSAAEKEKFKAQWSQAAEVKQIVAVLPNLRAAGGGPAASADDKPGSVEEMMRKRQRDLDNYQALSRMSTQMFQANMAIAANLGGGWRYQYRYR